MLRITTIINKIPIWIPVFLLLCLHFMLGQLNGNEEAYLLLAKQFFEPDFIPNSFNLNQFPSNRLWYQYIAGSMLKHLPFQDVALIGRVALAFLFAFPIARIIKLFQLTLIEGLFILQVFFFAHQSFFAHSWMFLSFEPKCMSYIFVLWSIYYMLKNQLNISTLLLVIATWFHVLVGGWTFVILCIYMIVQKNSIKQLFGRTLCYALLVAPLVWYLSQEISLYTENIVNGLHLDWVYTHYRNPHHTSPFQEWKDFAPGVLMMSAWGLLCLFFFTKLEQPILNKINVFNLIIIGLMFLFFGIAWFDDNGVFTKFCPFRPNTLLKFFLLFEVAMVIKLWLVQVSFLPYINTALLIFLIPYSAKPVYHLFQSHQEALPHELLWDDFTNHIQQNTPKDAVFVVFTGKKDHASDGIISFDRKTQRSRFVIYKIVPAGGNQIYEWYQRIQEKNKLVDDLNYISTLDKKYGLDYMVSHQRILQKNLELKYHNDRYFLYKIKE